MNVEELQQQQSTAILDTLALEFRSEQNRASVLEKTVDPQEKALLAELFDKQREASRARILVLRERDRAIVEKKVRGIVQYVVPAKRETPGTGWRAGEVVDEKKEGVSGRLDISVDTKGIVDAASPNKKEAVVEEEETKGEAEDDEKKQEESKEEESKEEGANIDAASPNKKETMVAEQETKGDDEKKEEDPMVEIKEESQE
jgi:hypothetical protein